MVRALLLLAAWHGAACSSSKPRTADDATTHPSPSPPPPAVTADAAIAAASEAASDAASDAASETAIDAARPPPNPDAKTGDLLVRVEWKDVPIPMRASPGKTACHTPRAPVVAPTTVWGIPDVFVIVDGAKLPAHEPRIVLADCALAPRTIAATSAVVESAADRPTRLAFTKRGALPALDKLAAGSPRTLRLPIAGHRVALALDTDGIYELAADGESAWLLASPSAGVTEPNGALLVRDLAPGTYPVTAWLPPRAGGPAKLAKGSVEVIAGDLAELTLVLK